MKVKDIIKHMKDYHPEDEIFIIWWDADSLYDKIATNKEWNQVVNNFDEYSFDGINNDIYEIMEEELENIRKGT